MQDLEQGSLDSDARNQLAGMAVMLTITQQYLPDAILVDLVQRLGGPTAYVGAVLSIAFDGPEFPMREELVAAAQDLLRRMRRLATPD